MTRTIILALVCAAVLGWFGTAVEAATTTQNIKLGDRFTGNIASPGDTLIARFNAAQDTRATIRVRKLRGSTLSPTVVLRDDTGAEIASGGSRARIRNFKIPASGSYSFEISGAAGSGDFRAVTRQRRPRKVPYSFLYGTVTNSLTGAGIPGVMVSIEPYSLMTDANGFYWERLPIGEYAVAFEEDRFEPQDAVVTLIKRVDATLDAALDPIAPVIVSASVDGDAMPDGTLTATATVDILDGSTLESFAWTQANSVTVTIDGADSDTATVTLPNEGAYKEELIHVLSEPPIAEDQLPPNVPLPEGEFPGGLQDRFHVVGVNPLALEEAALVNLAVTVTTSSGDYSDEAEIHAHLPWRVATGIRNVPIGIAVLLHGKDQATYDWALTAPSGSTATLADATSQNPEFTPDERGLYFLDVTDTGSSEVVTLEIYAGVWEGVITAQDGDGRPLAQNCTVCHDGSYAPDQFTPWAQTGHAEILTNNLNTSTHYGPNCFGCHTVGYDPGVDNGGSDDASDYGDFLASGLINNPGDNWTTMLADYPDTAQLANVQCENCHGPQNSDAHVGSLFGEDNRFSLSSDVCATCHGEPPRHARFQQWQLSKHADYELAIEEGGSGSCSRCHTANGFLAWLPDLLYGDPLAEVTVSWTEDEVHPQTCVTCHDPHAVGSSSGLSTDAEPRITGDTPLLQAGFTANGVGKGAICMTCHNSRRGLRNDATYGLAGTDTASDARAPHGPTQTDILMGQNAYLVGLGRGAHSFTDDTCVTCHMEETPPPDLLAYNLGGTNHTFFARNDICGECHGFEDASGVQSPFEATLAALKAAQEEAILQLMTDLTAGGDSIDLNGDYLLTGVGDISDIEFTSSRGRQAIAVTFTDGTGGTYRMPDIDVIDGTTGESKGILYEQADEAIPKAGWNWHLANNDGSRGVHNPSFAFAALDNAIAALNALAP